MDRLAIRELTRKAVESATGAPMDKTIFDVAVADLPAIPPGTGPIKELDAAEDPEAFIAAIITALLPAVDQRIESAIAAAKGNVDSYLLNPNQER